MSLPIATCWQATACFILATVVRNDCESNLQGYIHCILESRVSDMAQSASFILPTHKGMCIGHRHSSRREQTGRPQELYRW